MTVQTRRSEMRSSVLRQTLRHTGSVKPSPSTVHERADEHDYEPDPKPERSFALLRMPGSAYHPVCRRPARQGAGLALRVTRLAWVGTGRDDQA